MKKQKRERRLKDEEIKLETMAFRLEPNLKKEYINFCKQNGFAYGKRLRVLIIEDMNNKKINNDIR